MLRYKDVIQPVAEDSMCSLWAEKAWKDLRAVQINCERQASTCGTWICCGQEMLKVGIFKNVHPCPTTSIIILLLCKAPCGMLSLSWHTTGPIAALADERRIIQGTDIYTIILYVYVCKYVTLHHLFRPSDTEADVLHWRDIKLLDIWWEPVTYHWFLKSWRWLWAIQHNLNMKWKCHTKALC